MADELKIQIESSFNAAPIKAGLAEAATAVQVGGGQMQAAFAEISKTAQASGNALVANAAAFQAQGLSAKETASVLQNLGFSAQEAATAVKEVGAAAGATAPEVEEVAAAADHAATGFKGMSGATAEARVEMGALEGSTGMMASGLARIAGQSSALAPIISAAFPAFAAAALVDIIAMGVEKLYKFYENVVLLKSSIESLEKADESAGHQAAELNDQYEESLARRLEAQGKLGEAQKEYAKASADKPLEVIKIDDKNFKQFNADFVSFMGSVHTTADAPTVISKIEAEAKSTQVQLDSAKQKLAELKQAAIEQAGDNVLPLFSTEHADAEIKDLTQKLSLLHTAIGQVQSQTGTAKLTLQGDLDSVNKKKPPSDLSEYRDQLAQKEAVFEGSHTEMLLMEENFWNSLIQAGTVKGRDLVAVETEAAKSRVEARKQLISDLSTTAKSADTAEALASKEHFASVDAQIEQSVKEIAAITKLTEARKKDADEVAKQSEQNALKKVDTEEATAKGDASLQEQKLPTENLSAAARAKATDQIQQQELAKLRTFEDQKYQIELEYYSKQLALQESQGPDVKTPIEAEDQTAAVAKIYGQIEALNIQHNAKMAEINLQSQSATQKAATTTAQAWNQSFATINNGLTSLTAGILRGTETISQGFTRLAGNLVLSMITGFEKMALSAAENDLKMLLVHTTTNQSKIALDQASATTSQAISDESSLKQILSAAKTAFANTYASVSSIPVIGPALAPEAGAAAFAAVLAIGSAEKGAALPSDMLVLAHKNEMILPARFSKGIQNMINGGQGGSGGQGGPGGAGGDTHVHYSPSVSAMDGASVDKFLSQNKSKMTKMIIGAVRNGKRLK